MITSIQMAEAIRQHRLTVRPVPGGWKAETENGGRLHRYPTPTPEEAVEQALNTLTVTAQREEETQAGQVLRRLQAGRYYLRPRDVPQTDKLGQDFIQRVFDGFLLDNTPTVVIGEPSYRRAIERMEEVLRSSGGVIPNPPSLPDDVGNVGTPDNADNTDTLPVPVPSPR